MPSPSSTMSSFQPEFESTQQFDTATQSLQLPNLRSSAQRFSYYNPPQPDRHIDSSYVRDSFPDFTQRSPSPEASMSIEAGRAKKGSPKPLDISDVMLPTDSLYDLHSTPPRSTRPTPKKLESLRKEASLRRAHSSDKRANASQRRSLSDMHHKIHQESESSFVADDRPPTTTVQPRNTRFTSARLPESYSRQQGLQPKGTPQRPTPNHTATWSANQTQASFMLPDLPNITELVSGVRKDGTPLFSPSTKSRSRFTASAYNHPTITNTLTHAKLNSIAVPDDEKAIFASLQLLKDKVAALEADKSEAHKRLEEYESEVAQLRSRIHVEQKLRRPDSTLADEGEASLREKWRRERAVLQSTVKSLQERLDRGHGKLSINDIAMKRLTQERDDVVTQLGVAYYNSEELKSENSQLHAANDYLEAHVDALQTENSRLRLRLAQIKAQFSDETQSTNLKAKMQDPTMQSATTENEVTKSLKRQGSAKRRSSGRVGQDTRHNILDSIETEIKRSRLSAAPKDARSRSRSRSKSKTRQHANVESEVDSTTDLDFSRPVTNNIVEDDNDDDSRDVTYLSYLDPQDLARLRRTLEEERRASRSARPASAPSMQDNDTITKPIALPRKSSLRDMTKDDTGRFTIKSQVDEATGLLKNVRIQSPHLSDAISYSEPREMNETSMLSNSSRRRNRSKSIEEMTSAFILPDITLHATAGADIANEIEHQEANCTLCPPTSSQTKDTTVPNPIPVSTREDIDDTNATIRPSQPPPLALATVLKQLEDEVKHLKLQLSTYEKSYNSHDPALGRRKRLAVKSKISALMSKIERRSDQIYALYDVLEGQKSEGVEGDDGDEQEQENVETTLQSLGIDVEELERRAKESKRRYSLGLDGEESEDDDDLAWGGFSDESEVESVRVPGIAARKRGVV